MNDLMYENYENYGVFSKANRDWCFITFCKFFQNAWQAFIFVH